MSSSAFEQIASRVRTWGRFGERDRRGMLNLIDEAARRRALDAVVDAEAISLALPMSAAEGIQLGFIAGRINPALEMTRINEAEAFGPDGPWFNEDVVHFSMQCATHIDGLAHVSIDGQLYNGVDASLIDEHGSAELGIQHVGPIVTRGVLLDVARGLGLEYLEGGHPITCDDLEAAVAFAGLRPEPGDAVCVRTGHMRHLALGHSLDDPARDLVAYAFPSPGMTMETSAWLHDHGVALVATDNLTFEVYPGESDEDFLPVHVLNLFEMGLTQGQNWVLDDLAAKAAADGRSAFLLDATPLNFTGAVGSALTPVALR